MAIYRYTASADNTITNAFRSNLTGRGTGSNMGAADVLEAFYIVGQTSSSVGLSSEKSRILINFPFADIETDRSASVPTIPASGNVSWYIKLYNARHASTLPKNFQISVQPLSASWQEGDGLDMDEYTDQTYGVLTGSNWTVSSLGTNWTTPGGDIIPGGEGDSSTTGAQQFTDGTEDLEIDVSYMVEQMLHGSGSGLARYGFLVKLSGSYETGSQSYYTKKFFARSSEYFFKRPVLEARWDSSRKDSAATFYLSSALAPADDNVNTLYLYNYIRGQLTDIPGLTNNVIDVSLFSGSALNVTPTGDALPLPPGAGVASDGDTVAVGGKISRGVYTASLVYPPESASVTTVFPVWNKGGTQYHTGSGIDVLNFNASNISPNPSYVSKITNLKASYSRSENARFRLYVRDKDWSPTIYTVASTEIENYIVEDAYFKVFRIVDDLEVISYGTGSAVSPQQTGSAGSYTRLSYDISGNYFDLSMDLLEQGYAYGIKLAYYTSGRYEEQPEVFKFRVEE
tara:strand:+ start:6366 stop:7907 length:1542 start_codon:yes stop_codon:yes gene_type:complete